MMKQVNYTVSPQEQRKNLKSGRGMAGKGSQWGVWRHAPLEKLLFRCSESEYGSVWNYLTYCTIHQCR